MIARTYPGPHPIVAHPPCARWGRYWGGARHYGLQKRYPTHSTFDFGFFSMGFRLKQRLNRHSDHKACQVIGIKAGTLKRLKLAHALPIGPVLRACAYIGVHPFGYFAVQKILAGNVSRETMAQSIAGRP